MVIGAGGNDMQSQGNEQGGIREREGGGGVVESGIPRRKLAPLYCRIGLSL